MTISCSHCRDDQQSTKYYSPLRDRETLAGLASAIRDRYLIEPKPQEGGYAI